MLDLVQTAFKVLLTMMITTLVKTSVLKGTIGMKQFVAASVSTKHVQKRPTTCVYRQIMAQILSVPFHYVTAHIQVIMKTCSLQTDLVRIVSPTLKMTLKTLNHAKLSLGDGIMTMCFVNVSLNNVTNP